MVEQVESFGPEIQGEALGKPEPLLERGIDLVVAWSAANIAAQVPPGALGRDRECRWVEPVVDGPISRVNGLSRHQVGALGTSIAIQKVTRLALEGNVYRTARTGCRDARQLPAAEHGRQEPVVAQIVAAAAKGELVDRVRCHGVPDIDRRVAPIADAARHVLE